MGNTWYNFGFNAAALSILHEEISIGLRTITETYHGHLSQHDRSYTEEITVPAYDKKISSIFDIIPGEFIILHVLLYEDGRVYEEYIQYDARIPDRYNFNNLNHCIFLALRDYKTKEPILETLWPKHEVSKYN